MSCHIHVHVRDVPSPSIPIPIPMCVIGEVSFRRTLRSVGSTSLDPDIELRTGTSLIDRDDREEGHVTSRHVT